MSLRRNAGLFRASPDRAELLHAAELLEVEGPSLAHAFEPHGESVAVLGATRRVVLHTWPEHALVTVDLYADEEVSLAVLGELGWEPVPEAGDGERATCDPDGSVAVSDPEPGATE